MKFHMLPVGARFEFRDRIYLKSGPLTATDDGGGQQLFPRAATVRPLGDPPAAPARAPAANLPAEAVLDAFETLERSCRQCLADLAPGMDDEEAEALGLRLDAAGESFLRRLGLTRRERP